MSVTSAPRHFRDRSLDWALHNASQSLANTHRGSVSDRGEARRPDVPLSLGERIFSSRREPKRVALGDFAANLSQSTTPKDLLQRLLAGAGARTLQLVNATVSDQMIDISIENRSGVSFSFASTEQRADAEIYLAAHKLSAKAVLFQQNADPQKIGKLRDSIYEALRTAGPEASIELRAGIINFNSGVRNALKDLGLGTSVISVGTDASSAKTLTLVDLSFLVPNLATATAEKRTAEHLTQVLKHDTGWAIELIGETVEKLRKNAYFNANSRYQSNAAVSDNELLFNFRIDGQSVNFALPSHHTKPKMMARKLYSQTLQRSIAEELQRQGVLGKSSEVELAFRKIATSILEPVLTAATELPLTTELLRNVADKIAAKITSLRECARDDENDSRLRQYLSNEKIANLGHDPAPRDVLAIKIAFGLASNEEMAPRNLPAPPEAELRKQYGRDRNGALVSNADIAKRQSTKPTVPFNELSEDEIDNLRGRANHQYLATSREASVVENRNVREMKSNVAACFGTANLGRARTIDVHALRAALGAPQTPAEQTLKELGAPEMLGDQTVTKDSELARTESAGSLSSGSDTSSARHSGRRSVTERMIDQRATPLDHILPQRRPSQQSTASVETSSSV